MKTSRTYILLLLVCTYWSAIAGDSTRVHKHEIGLNLRSFIAKSIDANLDNPEIGIYYKRPIEKVQLRSYLGFTPTKHYDNEETQVNDSVSTTKFYRSRNNALFFRLGIEKRKTFHSKIYVAAGIDFISKYSWGNNNNWEYTKTMHYSTGIIDYSNEIITYKSTTALFGFGAGLSLSVGIPLGNRMLLTFENLTNVYVNSTHINQHTIDPVTSNETHQNLQLRKLEVTNDYFISTITLSYKL